MKIPYVCPRCKSMPGGHGTVARYAKTPPITWNPSDRPATETKGS